MHYIQSPQQDQMILPIGAIVHNVNGDRYAVENLLGKGGSSAVYLVHDKRNKEDRFALKELIDPDRAARDRFAFEAEVLMRLDHDALPRVYRVFENERLKRIYILMDYIEGQNLEVLRKEQPDERFILRVALDLLTPIVAALKYLHHRQPPIVHRDIKPANIVVPEKGGDALLVDFGLAKEHVNDGTTTVIRRGTPGYAALEQYGGGTNISTDVYGLAATLYTLITGIIPVDALTRAGGDDPLQPAHELVPALPIGVSEAISRGMSIKREERFATIDEFWVEVNAHTKKLKTVPVYDSATGTTKASHTIEGTARKVATIGLNTETEGTDTTDKLMLTTPRTRVQRVKKNITKMTLAEQRQIAQKERRRNTLLAVLGLFTLLLALGVGIITFALHNPQPVANIGRSYVKGQGTSVATPTVSQYPYPTLASAYQGSMHDYLNDKSVNSSLSNVQQNKGMIHGSCNCLGLIGAFTGNVSADGTISFTMKMVDRGTNILFQGHIKTGGDMAGQFYIIDANGQHTGEYGDWSFK